MQTLVAKLLVRNELTAEQAAEYYKDPRTGDFRRVLKRTWIQQDKSAPSDKGKASKEKPAKNAGTSKKTTAGPSSSSSAPSASTADSTPKKGKKHI